MTISSDDPAPANATPSSDRRLLVQPDELRALLRKFSHRVGALFAPKTVVAMVAVRGPGAAMALRMRRWMAADNAFASPEAIPLAGVDPATGAITPAIDLVGKEVLLFDAVISSGRTALAALEAILASARAQGGEPKFVRLACLVDAGGRRLPIQPEAVGIEAPRGEGEIVRVKMKPLDPDDEIAVERAPR